MDNFTASDWKKILELLRQDDPSAALERWFSPLAFVSSDTDTITLAAPDEYFANLFKENYLERAQAAAEQVSGKKWEIRLAIKPQAAEPATEALAGRQRVVRSDAVDTLGLNPNYTFDEFVVGPSNRFANAASMAVAQSPAKAYNPLFIYGKVGLGKTHLLQAIGHYIATTTSLSVLYITSEKFTNQLINAIQNRTTLKFRQMYRSIDVLLIDDIQFIAGKESTQEEFFHTFNSLYDAHRQIVLSCDRPPKEIHALEARLVSRFEWGLVADIQPPDIETRTAILRKKAERETIAVADDVTLFIAEKITSNIRELEGALIKVVAKAKLEGLEVNLEMAKAALRDILPDSERKVSIDNIQKRVAAYFDIKLSDMRARKRSKAIAYPRQIAMYLARDLTDASLLDIGEKFGGRDHTTVIHAYEKVQYDIKKDQNVRNLINRLIGDIKGG